MTYYRVEFYHPADQEWCLLGRFPAREEAELLFEKEWARWCSLAADPSFKHTVSRVNGAEFLVQLPSGKRIVYRVQVE